MSILPSHYVNILGVVRTFLVSLPLVITAKSVQPARISLLGDEHIHYMSVAGFVPDFDAMPANRVIN